MQCDVGNQRQKEKRAQKMMHMLGVVVGHALIYSSVWRIARQWHVGPGVGLTGGVALLWLVRKIR